MVGHMDIKATVRYVRDCFESIPPHVNALGFVTGALVSNFAGRLPESLQDFGLWLGIALAVVTAASFILHVVRTAKTGVSVSGDSSPGLAVHLEVHPQFGEITVPATGIVCQVQINELLMGGAMYAHTAPGSSYRLGIDRMGHYRYEVRNYSKVPLFNCSLVFDVALKKVVSKVGGWESDGIIIRTGTIKVPISRLDPDPNTPFVFFATNITGHLATLASPDTVGFVTLEGLEATAPLRSSDSSIDLWPQQDDLLVGAGPAGSTYWTLTEAISWVAFGIATTEWTPTFLRDQAAILPPEEKDALVIAKNALLEQLRDPDLLVAFGRLNGETDHTQIPHAYFLSSAIGADVFSNSFGLDLSADVGAFIDHRRNPTRWDEVRIKRADILRNWPAGKLYQRPAPNAANAEKLAAFLQASAEMLTRQVKSDLEFEQWSQDYQRWFDDVLNYIRSYLSKARGDMFAARGVIIVTDRPGAYNAHHSGLLNHLAVAHSNVEHNHALEAR